MRILMINSVCGIRSTGRICTDLTSALEKEGNEVKIAYGREVVPEYFQKYSVKIGNNFDIMIHGIKSRLFDYHGFASKKQTEKFLRWIDEYNPDVIHLHNIHGYYINIELLANYLKTCGKKIIWTLHDCWSFTGHCAYFDFVQCDKWKTGCRKCSIKGDYPASFIDNSAKNYLKKKKLFTDIPNLTIVTPSQWLADLVKQSYLKDYPVVVINNGVNTDIFSPKISNIKEKYNISHKKVVLGVAAIWDKRKGLNDILELRKILNDEYVIVLIGLTKEQLSVLPENVTGIPRTNSAEELAQWYSCADVFLNPTYEDNYPTTNLEAIACGTPVVTYNTGGSVESASLYGAIAEKGDINKLKSLIENNDFTKKQNSPSIKKMVDEYLKMY